MAVADVNYGKPYETVGKSPHRLDAKSKATGRAVFIEDMRFHGMLYGKVLLDENPHPSPKEVRTAIAGNLCRCTGYKKIDEAILAVAGTEPGH